MIRSQSGRRRTLPEVAFFRASLCRALPMILLLNLLFVGMPTILLWLIKVQIGEVPDSLPFPARFFYGYVALLCVSAAAVALPPVYELSMRLRLSPLPLSDVRLAGITWSSSALLMLLFCSLVHIQIEAIFAPGWNPLLAIGSAFCAALVIEGTAVCFRGCDLRHSLLACLLAIVWFTLAAVLLPNDSHDAASAPLTLCWLAAALCISWWSQKTGWKHLRHGHPGLAQSWDQMRGLIWNRLSPQSHDTGAPQSVTARTAVWSGMHPAFAAATGCATLLMSFLVFSMSTSQLRDDRILMQPFIALLIGGLLPGSIITGIWLGNLYCRQSGQFRPFWATVPLSDRDFAQLLQFTTVRAAVRLNVLLWSVAVAVLATLAAAILTGLAAPQQQYWLQQLTASVNDSLYYFPLIPAATLLSTWTVISAAAAWFTVSAHVVQSPLRASLGMLALCWSIMLVFANNHLPDPFHMPVRLATCITLISPLLWQWYLLRQVQRYELLPRKQLTCVALWMLALPLIIAAFQQPLYATLALILCGYSPACAAVGIPLAVRVCRHN